MIKYTKEELEQLGKENINLRYKNLIIDNFKKEEYYNPLFVGCYIKYEELMKHIEETNSYNSMVTLFQGIKTPRYQYNLTALDFYENVMEKGYLDLSFSSKIKKITYEEIEDALIKDSQEKNEERIRLAKEEQLRREQEKLIQAKKDKVAIKKAKKLAKKQQKEKEEQEFYSDMEAGFFDDD